MITNRPLVKFALDPINSPLTRKPAKAFRTRLHEGLFGVFRDARPEGYGRDGSGEPTTGNLLVSAGHFGVSTEDAATWLVQAASVVTEQWQALAREARIPASFCDEQQFVSFALAGRLVAAPDQIWSVVEKLKSTKRTPKA